MRIHRTHELGTVEVRRRIDDVAADVSDRLGIRSEWQGNNLKVNGNGVNGQIRVSDGAVDVDVNLGFGLKLMESAIRSSIENALDKHLA